MKPQLTATVPVLQILELQSKIIPVTEGEFVTTRKLQESAQDKREYQKLLLTTTTN